MKLSFKGPPQITVNLSRGDDALVITLTAIPLGYRELIETAFPAPVVFVDMKPTTPEGPAADQHTVRVSYIILARAIGPDVMDTREPGPGSTPAQWAAYADAVKAEFSAAGFTLGEILYLYEQVVETLETLSFKGLQDISGNSGALTGA